MTREAYPDLAIPFHARWRHFVAGEPRSPTGDPAERARAAFDLVIVSVLLDAGAGPGLALSRPGERRDLRALGRASPSPASGCSRPAPLPPIPPCRCAPTERPRRARRRDSGRRLPGRRGQSAGRPRRPRRLAAPARRAGRGAAGPVRQRRRAPPRRALRRARRARRGRQAAGRGDPRTCCSRRSGRSGRTGW